MRASGTLMCVGSAAAFGAMGIFGKLAYRHGVTAGTLLSVRFVLAASVFWTVMLVSGAARDLRSAGTRDLATAFGLGVFGYAAQAGLYFVALERLDASLLSLLLYTFPAMVAVAAVLLGRERVDRRRVTALALALVGLALVLNGAGAGDLDALGAALGLGAAVVYTAYILSSQGVAGRMRPQLLATLVCSGAAVALTAGSALFGQLRPGDVGSMGWLWLAAIAVVSTVVAITLFFAGLKRVGPTAASILSTVEPVTTVVLAFLAFGETLSAVQLAGGALVLSAVFVLQAGRAQRTRNRTWGPITNRSSGEAPATSSTVTR